MQTTYAKLLSETSIDRNPPRSAVIDGAFVCGTLPAPYLATLGYYPLRETPAPAPAEGCHVEPRYAFDGGEVVQSWVQVENPPPPPRSFSKRRLYRALTEDGLWDAVKGYMELVGVWDDFDLATTLDENDPLILAAVQTLQAQLEIPPEQIEKILSASVAE